MGLRSSGQTQGARMDDLDSDCSTAAEQVLNRAQADDPYDDLDCSAAAEGIVTRTRNDELTIATLQSSLKITQAAAAAIAAMADRVAGKPSRTPRNRTIRVVYDDDGVAIGTEDVAPAPAAADVGEPVVPEPAAPDGKLWGNVFGSIAEEPANEVPPVPYVFRRMFADLDKRR
jgi:hypothetical protein